MTPKPETDASRARRRAPKESLPRSRTVLLLVDVINPLDFEGAEDLSGPALAAAAVLRAFKRELAARGVPAIYVNDNFGHWQSNFLSFVAHCRQRNGAAARLARALAPSRDDLTVLKPRQSAFHQTPLELLLAQMGAKNLIVVGFSTDLCVQFSAMDAYVRGFRLWVPEDCTAAESPARKAAALQWMRVALKAYIRPAGGGVALPTP